MNTKDLITIEGIKRHLSTDTPLHIFRSTDSTNTQAKKMATEGAPHGTTVIALHQTGGRGRLGRIFHAPAGTGIYMSIILRPGSDISRALLVTTAASVAVCRAVKDICSAEPVIKWVNDIYINNKKVCGILTEAITDTNTNHLKALIVGIGINCSTEGFPEELQEIAGAVEGDYSPDQLTARIITEILNLADDLDSRRFMDEYRRLSMVIGKNIKVYKGGYSDDVRGIPARVLDVDDNGGLQVLYSDGSQETLSSGEISIRL